MVKIYIGYVGKDLVYDVDAYFNISKIDVEKSKELFLYLEEAQDLLEDEEKGYVFVDSFGILQDINNCSTGTKAIIYAINYPEKVVNLDEVGRGHYLTIVNNSAVYNAQFTKRESYDAFLEYDNNSKDISIVMDGYEFTKLCRLEYYLRIEKDEDDV